MNDRARKAREEYLGKSNEELAEIIEDNGIDKVVRDAIKVPRYITPHYFCITSIPASALDLKVFESHPGSAIDSMISEFKRGGGNADAYLYAAMRAARVKRGN